MRTLCLIALAGVLLASPASAGKASPDSTVRVIAADKNLMMEALRHQGQPISQVDAFTGVRHVWVSLPHGLPHHGDAEVYLTAAGDSTVMAYGLYVTDRPHAWKWIDSHHGDAIADSVRLDLGDGRWNGSVIATGILYRESVSYDLDRRQLETLASATAIALRVGWETFTLDPRDAWAWRAFLRATPP